MITDIMHTVASAFRVPVIVLLLLMALFMVVMLGMLVAEFFTERRYFRLDVPKLVDDLRASDDPAAVVRESGMLRRQKTALLELLGHPQATEIDREAMAVNIVAQEQAIFDNRVKVTDFISKVAPMLGLMGTLIPLGPGVIAIGAGDTQVLSESLLIAFDTTIIGLIVAALALLVSTIRKSWYAKYSAAFEAACEVVLQKANESAADDSSEGAISSSPAGPQTPVGASSSSPAELEQTEGQDDALVDSPQLDASAPDVAAPAEGGDHA